MAQVADQLAVAVGTQWTNEAAMRRLNDPYPLPVSWAAADPSLTDCLGLAGEAGGQRCRMASASARRDLGGWPG